MGSVRGVVLAIAVLLFAAPLWGQTGTSAIRGTITDQQGRLVANATVTLTNMANSASRSTKSTSTGDFVFDLIPPGDYRLEVQATGFRSNVVNNVHALIGKQTESSVQLEVGAATEVVEVTASSQEALINTQDASLGNNFISEQITQLPLEARNLVDLLSLQPGSTREGYTTGARADQSNVTLDGVDINNAQSGNANVPATTNSLGIGTLGGDRGDITSGPVLRLNAEAIEEFRVTTANGGANQGRSSGSQVNLVTKSGTNSFHGAAFEFYRSRGFTANDWFNTHAQPVVDRQPLIRHTFGGALGGPIVKNRAFFFYSYESRHDASGTGQSEVVPLPSLGQGIINYRYCADAACNSVQQASLDLTQNEAAFHAVHDGDPANPAINPAALSALAAAAAKYPANDSSLGDSLNTAGFRFNSPTPVRLNSHVAKLDFNLNNNQVAFLRANVIYDHQTQASWLPDTQAPLVWNHPWGLAAGHTWTLGNHWVNNFRYGYTRQAFDQAGDSNGNDISFRFVFQPNGQQHTLSRVTPVHNFTDDVSWIHGNHNIQFGANIRLVSNSRISFANAYDIAITNPSFYLGAGENISDTFQQYLIAQGLPGGRANESLDSPTEVQNAATAIIGRLSQYTADFTFGQDGTLLAPGQPAVRDFKTQAYDSYVQDTWKVRPNLTLTLGLRYSLERPVYEANGFEVQPNIPLGTYFAERLAAANEGRNFIDPIVINKSGPANGGPSMYNWDKNNFQPRIALAWSPDGGDGFLGRVLGHGGTSVFRGGFALTNDYFGQALAVDFDLNNTLGFTSNFTTPANTYDTQVSGQAGLAPLFTGFNQDIRTLPNVNVPSNLQFPLKADSDEGERIEQSVDSKLHAPTEYVWNFTFERQLPAGMVFSASYIGRKGRSLLARRDAVAFNNVRDPQSGVTWYEAGTALEKQRQKGIDTSQIATIPFFENLFPAGLGTMLNNDFGLDPTCSGGNAGFDPTWSNTQVFYAMQSRTPSNPCAFFAGNDWTDTQALVDQVMFFDIGPDATRFMQPQYGALSAWSTIGNSNYHALTLSLRERLNSVSFDLNYSYAHSLDDASGLQGDTAFAVAPFIVNPIRQHDNYASSDFDVKHNVNASAVWQMPFGKGKAFLSDAKGIAQAALGGWQLSGIFRWNTGLPTFSPFDDARWATNWNVQAGVTPIRAVHTCPTKTETADPKLFGGCGDIDQVYQSFRNAYPGETGPRNIFRVPDYIDLDLGIGKSFNIGERYGIQLRWDVFNVTNTQHFSQVSGSRTGFGVGRDPALQNSSAPSSWSNFVPIVNGQARIMQIGARFSF